MQRMGVDPTDPGFTRVNALRAYGSDGVVLDFPWPRLASFPDFGVVRTRLDFDHLLLQRASKAGSRVMEGVEVVAPVTDDGWVAGAELAENGRPRRVRTRYVVAADGASSRFAARAGVRRDPGRPVGTAVRRYYRSPRRRDPVLESFLTLRDGSGLMAGYGWIFPVGSDLYNVGVGILKSPKHSKDLTSRKVMDTFLSQVPAEWEMNEENAVGPVMSGPIPMGVNRSPLAVPGMVVVGDAGGIVNPFNGEGIAYAIETGELAAELISDALARGRPGLVQLYPSLVRERYGSYFHIGRNWLKMLGNPTFMRLAVKYGIPRRRLMAFALRFMAFLTDGKDGSGQDRIMHALMALAPER